jgi:hypothetical protein
MLRRATSSDTLLRPDRLLGFLKVVTKSIQADEDLTFNDMKDLAFRLKDLDPQKVQFMTVPVDRLAMRSRLSVVLLDEPAMTDLFAKIRDDEFFPDKDAKASAKPTTGPALTVAPSKIRVDVLNGTGTKGFARKGAEALAGVGFDIGDITNAKQSTYSVTEVHYGSDRFESARTVSAAIPGSRLVPDDTLGRTVVVVLGSDFEGVSPVKVSGAPASAAPGVKPTVAPRTAADDPCAA